MTRTPCGGHPDRDWPDGCYRNRCMDCFLTFIGSKYRFFCRACIEGNT